MIVMKFGGTSNQDAAAMSNVIRIVKAHLAEQPVVGMLQSLLSCISCFGTVSLKGRRAYAKL